MKSITEFYKAKERREKITFISTYDYWSARLCEEAGIDGILVGDSLSMVVQGNDSTLPVTIDEMIYHSKAVRRGAPNTFVVVDMPFMSYHVSVEEAVRNAGRVLKETGANAVKIEGGSQMAEVVKKLVSVGIPVMGHIGLTPQFVNQLGGYKVQGKTYQDRDKLKEDALSLQQAGCFSIVLEAIPSSLAKEITDSLTIPTIGIGAGPDTDGQILVFHDLVGMFEKTPKFVKRYAEVGRMIKDALVRFSSEVKDGKFPSKEYEY